jgi:hypothetical protein
LKKSLTQTGIVHKFHRQSIQPWNETPRTDLLKGLIPNTAMVVFDAEKD